MVAATVAAAAVQNSVLASAAHAVQVPNEGYVFAGAAADDAAAAADAADAAVADADAFSLARAGDADAVAMPLQRLLSLASQDFVGAVVAFAVSLSPFPYARASVRLRATSESLPAISQSRL